MSVGIAVELEDLLDTEHTVHLVGRRMRGSVRSNPLDALTGAAILVVTAQAAVVELMERIAARRSCKRPRFKDNVESAARSLDINPADIIVVNQPCAWVSAALWDAAPVVVLDDMHDTTNLVLALEMGAADYITMEADTRIIEARLNAALRRARMRGAVPILRRRLGVLTVETDTRRVFLRGVEVALTKTEFELLVLLATPDKPVWSREDLLYGLGRETRIQLRTVDSWIVQVRRKLGDARGAIVTIPGFGYRFDPGAIPGP